MGESMPMLQFAMADDIIFQQTKPSNKRPCYFRQAGLLTIQVLYFIVQSLRSCIFNFWRHVIAEK